MHKTLAALVKKAEKDPSQQWAPDLAERIVAVVGDQIEAAHEVNRSMGTVASLMHDANDLLENAVESLQSNVWRYKSEIQKHDALVEKIRKMVSASLPVPGVIKPLFEPDPAQIESALGEREPGDQDGNHE